ncbi:hypothetical protein VHEMI05487 [[Torrubiella] hemipterigena]|uniref:Peptidase A1 domain-containing protein n=1 Tax=[Torrubiella] hemipterigena TaxID=1531966 RepID=A0A0A1T4D8_9HYPO|nr:hypothetical protein VHEMI05487 [[Torrubiella] hemipterigena]
MRSTLVSVAAALPAVTQAALSAQNLAIVDDNRMVQVDGILKFPVTGNHGDIPEYVLNGPSKRQDGSALGNQLRGNFYTIPLSIGTPGNRVDVVFDTGSWELWVNPICSKSRNPAFCAKFGRLTDSTSIQNLKAQTNLTYGTGYAFIDYFQDTIAVGSARLSKQIFGVAKDSAFWETGIMGTGPSPRGFNDPKAGYLFVDTLAKEGITKSRAFGLDLAGIDSQRGSVVFGGVDKKKFRGTLERLPIVTAANTPDGAARYWVTLDGISLSADGKSTQVVGSQTVFLDSGAQVANLPQSVVDQIVKVFPGAKLAQYGQYQVACSLRSSANTLDFKFGKTTIKVSYNDFIYQYPGSDYCYLGVQVAYGQMYSLGDSFLRSAYVVYDQDHQELSIAQSADCGTNLVPIGPGPAGPLVGDCNKPPVTSSTTSSAVATQSSASSSTSFSSSSQMTSKTNPSSSAATNSKSESQSKSQTIASSNTNGATSTSKPSVTHIFTNSSTIATQTTAYPTYTSTFTTTTVYTITSCPPVVTNCPIGHKTTEIIEVTTTWCPGESLTKNPVTSTAVVTPIGPSSLGCHGSNCPVVGPQSSNSVAPLLPGASSSVNVPPTSGTSSVQVSNEATGSYTPSAQPSASVPVTASAPLTFQGMGYTLLGATTVTILAMML